MAFVDELRHQQKQVQEHLDLPQRRAEIAEHIRAYYLSNNITFDDDLIEHGVRQVFAHRLMFEAPRLNGFDTWLVKTLVQRSETPFWGRLILLTVGALVVGGWWLIQSHDAPLYSQEKINAVTFAARDARNDRNKLYEAVDKQRRALGVLQRSNAQQPDPNVSRLLQRAQALIPVNDVRTNIGDAEPVSADNLAVIESQIKALGQEKSAINSALRDAETNMKYAGSILSIREGVKDLLQDPKRAAAIAQISDLDKRLTELDLALEQIDSDRSYQEANDIYQELSTDLFPKDLLDLQISRANALKYNMTSKAIPEDIREELEMNLAAIQAELDQGDADAAEKKISHLTKRLKASGYWSR
jgi:hypothetical protein